MNYKLSKDEALALFDKIIATQGLEGFGLYHKALALASVVAWFATRALAFVLRLISPVLGSHFSSWFVYRQARFRARMHDHRSWMMGVGMGRSPLSKPSA